jgi:hypothetical protein
MKISKIFSYIGLTVLLLTGLTPAGQAALVQSPWQPVDLQGNSGTDTSGTLSFSKLNQVKSNGKTVPFVLPSNQDIVITWMQFNVTAVNTTLSTNADLRVGPYYSGPATTINGAAGFMDGFDPGFRISFQGFTNPSYNNFYAVDLKTGGIIPGTINVRLIGYLVTAR